MNCLSIKKEVFMSWVSTYFTALVAKMQQSSYVTNPDNIQFISEDVDLFGLPDSSFPRISILPIKLKGNGYEDQRGLNLEMRYMLVGHLRRANETATFADGIELVDFGVETMTLNFKLLDDKLSGTADLGQGFIQFDPYPGCVFDFELFPKVSTFICRFAGEFINNDTEE